MVVPSALTLLGVREVLPKLTVELETKALPVIVSVKLPELTIAWLGLRPFIVGAGLAIVKGKALDVPPPGGGLVTVTFTVWATFSSELGIVTVIVDPSELTLLGVREVLPKLTVEEEMKLAPPMVRTKAPLLT